MEFFTLAIIEDLPSLFCMFDKEGYSAGCLRIFMNIKMLFGLIRKEVFL
jgi:hypothetical protein